MTCYAVGSYILDRRAGELRRGASTIAVSPKAFDLLVYMVQNHGRLVGHDELLDALWPSTAVGAGSLSRAIADLRRALDDDPADAQYIQTVPRRGYRWIAEPHEVEEPRPQHVPFSLVYKRRSYGLRPGENIVGRSDESVVPIQSPAVSRQHARIIVTESEATLHDLGSKNGTYIGTTRVKEETVLNDGDEISIGPVKLVFVRSRDDRSTLTERPSFIDR